MIPSDLLIRIKNFQGEVHSLLARYETSRSRLVDLSKTYAQLQGLSLRQDDLFRQALRCVEHELYRAAHVMAWAAFMDFLEEKIVSKGFKKLHSFYPAWATYKDLEDLRENVPEYQLIECTKKLKLCTRTQVRALHGLLNKRNECAHPIDFYPELNESLGYISELIQRIKQLQPK
jgi:cation transport regulator ChaB